MAAAEKETERRRVPEKKIERLTEEKHRQSNKQTEV